MANLNKVMLMGNLTRDPELRYTPKGTAVTDISIAINRVWQNEQNQKQEETTFVDVTLWGRQAELAQQYLAKGRGVYVEGRLQLDTWDDKQSGQKRSKLRIVGENLQFLPGSGGNANGGSRQSSAGNRRSNQPQQSAPADDYGDDDDIPFN
ncbi:MAG: single-stranded DNA-binding protein [Luteolibacter sp.]